jgi:hypothetical protein
MYPMGNIFVKPDFRLSMGSNPRPHQKQGAWELSELVKDSLHKSVGSLRLPRRFAPRNDTSVAIQKMSMNQRLMDRHVAALLAMTGFCRPSLINPFSAARQPAIKRL